MWNGPLAQPCVETQPLLTPLSAHSLAVEELARRSETESLGCFKCGCVEVDDRLLLGGFSHGTVVGISSDDENEVGLLLALQTLIRSILDNKAQRAVLVTPLSSDGILRRLQAVATSQLESEQKTSQSGITSVKDCLSRVMVSCVFDIDGLWQVFAEFDASNGGAEPSPTRVQMDALDATQEIQDSEDEGSSLSNQDKDHPQASVKGVDNASKDDVDPTTDHRSNLLPGFILICGFSNLLTSLFAQRQRNAAHSSLALFGSQLRFTARSLTSKPLIMVLNSTSSEQEAASSAVHLSNEPPLLADSLTKPQKRLDPTLNSIFNPPSATTTYGREHRQGKPKFGLIFSQFLDMHLLCSQLPRTNQVTETMLAQAQGNTLVTGYRQDTIIEVLFDGAGRWQLGHGNTSREQLWVAVNTFQNTITERS